MPTQTFPEAKKLDYYEIDGKLHLRLLERDAKGNPAAFRALFGDKLAWFVAVVFEQVTDR